MPISVNNVPARGIEKVASHKVVALAYEGLCTFEFGIVVELFGLPRPELDHWYSFEVCGLERGPLHATGGVCVVPRRGLKGLLDTLIIPGWRTCWIGAKGGCTVLLPLHSSQPGGRE
jgi:AraC family transcriptional activator FtrA